MLNIEVFVTNLGLYNEGDLVGEWLTLPATPEAVENCLSRIGIDGKEYEEYFLTDWESETEGLCEALGVSEYSSIGDLNTRLSDIPDIDEEGIMAAFEHFGDLNTAIEAVTDHNYMVFYGCHSDAEVAMNLLDEYGYFDSIPESVRAEIMSYFDYEKYARDFLTIYWREDGAYIFFD